MRLPVLAAVTFLSGCSLLGAPVDEDNFGEQYATLSCKVTKKCFRGNFEYLYDGDINDCIDENMDLYEEAEDYFNDADCNFDDGKAEDCLADLREAECGDYADPDEQENLYENCNEVWEC
ncbi:MAG: hypothetical protein H6742_10125 [Alphaproteobacteria bacterium]|nr:hypothetical protein [Alphaproteobacteria bacterium]